jgi:flagellum-specific peptidoglycan hydrolase FlgJ
MDQQISDFIDKIRTPALAMEAVSGIPWRFAMVQACHESNHGTSQLAMIASNLFGVTGDDVLAAAGVPPSMDMPTLQLWLTKHPEVEIVMMKTEESHPLPPEKIRYWTRPGDILSKIQAGSGSNLFVERPFRKYDDWQASLLDWASRIQRRYPLAYAAAKAGHFDDFARALQSEGYATDQRYAAQLIVLNAGLTQDLA